MVYEKCVVWKWNNIFTLEESHYWKSFSYICLKQISKANWVWSDFLDFTSSYMLVTKNSFHVWIYEFLATFRLYSLNLCKHFLRYCFLKPSISTQQGNSFWLQLVNERDGKGQKKLAFWSGICLLFWNLQKGSFTCMECGFLHIGHECPITISLSTSI